jgi:hypothetical protein
VPEISQERKDRIKKRLALSAAFAAGAVTTVIVIRYRNGIGLNEVIWAVPVENMREAVAAGSKYLLDTPNGEMFVTTMPRASGTLAFK